MLEERPKNVHEFEANEGEKLEFCEGNHWFVACQGSVLSPVVHPMRSESAKFKGQIEWPDELVWFTRELSPKVLETSAEKEWFSFIWGEGGVSRAYVMWLDTTNVSRKY